uniref:G_PROTEIN_RECEP_F1_2 domain-containing protein n=1 Tax=Rhabditophanes sp. KR3021 TaxID=114890 RepID=A0AC35TKG1_9BILA
MVEFVFSQEVIQRKYPCNGMSVAEWKAQGEPNLYLGIVYICIGIIFIILYIPAIIVLSTKNLLENSCYKIMLFLSYIDILTLITVAVITGFFTISGEVYCSNQMFILYTGVISMFGWNVACFLCLVLAFNRCLDLCSSSVWNFLFEGKRTLTWIFAAISYGTYTSLFNNAIFFTKSSAWLFNPFYLITVKNFTIGIDYYNYLEAVNNVVEVVGLSTMYGIFIIMLFCQFKKTSNVYKLSSPQKSLLIQTTLTCSVSMVTATLYVIMNFFIVTEWLIILGQLTWQLSHCCGAISLTLCNKTIRTHIFNDLFPNSFKNYFGNKTAVKHKSLIKITIQKNTTKHP